MSGSFTRGSFDVKTKRYLFKRLSAYEVSAEIDDVMRSRIQRYLKPGASTTLGKIPLYPSIKRLHTASFDGTCACSQLELPDEILPGGTAFIHYITTYIIRCMPFPVAPPGTYISYRDSSGVDEWYMGRVLSASANVVTVHCMTRQDTTISLLRSDCRVGKGFVFDETFKVAEKPTSNHPTIFYTLTGAFEQSIGSVMCVSGSSAILFFVYLFSIITFAYRPV